MGILAVSSSSIMSIFDVIIFFYGLYTVYTIIKAKKTGVPAKWLLTEQESQRCKDLPAFIDAIYRPTIFFGCVVTIYGALCILNGFVFNQKIIEIICLVVFLAVCTYYLITLNKARKKYF